MKYKNTTVGVFISRPNRFIARVEIDGEEQVCHVKNTGRCRELLTDRARVVLEISDNPARKTKYDLLAVYKGNELINMDSQAPNKAVGEWIKDSGYFGDECVIRPEYTYNSSRFDFYVETEGRKIFIEVKGVTLENDGVVMFPDAPTERGIKHLRELAHSLQDGYEAYVIFVIQMKNCRYFTPNAVTHPAFAQTLSEVAGQGVNVLAMNCDVTEDSMSICGEIDVLI